MRPAEPIGDGRVGARDAAGSVSATPSPQTPTAPRTRSRSAPRRRRSRSLLETPPLAAFAPRRLEFQQAWLRARIAVSALTEALLVVMQAVQDLQDVYDRESVASDDDLE